jgi:hypothetical protein
MAERMWEDQHPGVWSSIACQLPCKTFLIVELLHWVKELYKRIVSNLRSKVMALDELLDSESTSHEWSQSCVSRN